MRVIHVIPGDLWAGAESQVFYNVKKLVENKSINLSVVLFNKGRLFEKLVETGVNCVIFDEDVKNSFRISLLLKNYFLYEKPDIIHTHEYKSHILSVFARKLSNNPCKIVRTIHGRTSVPFRFKYFKSYLTLRIENLLLKHATDAIIAVSSEIYKLFCISYPKTHIFKINNAIEVPIPIKKEPSIIRKEFGVAESTLWIGTTARLVPVKNLSMLIELAKRIKEKNNNFNFLISIFGDGPLYEELNNMINRYNLNDSVKLHGHSDDVISIMNALDVFSLSSEMEGLPMSLLEAMGLGTIPVCTKVGGMKEVIENDKSGFLIELNDIDGYIDTVNLIKENSALKEQISRNARKRIEVEYSIQKSVDLLMVLYEKCRGNS